MIKNQFITRNSKIFPYFLYKFICNIMKTEDIQIFLSFSVKLFRENRLVKLLKLLLFNVNLANPVQKK